MFFGTRQTSPTEYSLFYGRSRRVSSKDKKYEVQRGLESCSQPGRHITTRRFGPNNFWEQPYFARWLITFCGRVRSLIPLLQA
ncbi:unnamed protein product [Rhizophagus irregularis]|nr:unnamed protein product [Rhizophagus irregularis]